MERISARGLKRKNLSEELVDAELLKIKDESNLDSLKLRIKRIKNNIIHERRLKLRKRGSGRKVLMDENDEIFLAKAIENKATAHGRRKDSVLYLNHRVKKKDLLKLVNYNREKRSLPLPKSVTTMYNRSRPKNNRSTEARNHIGLSLFCSKKPPKAEDSNNLLTHFCRAHKKNIIRKLWKMVTNRLKFYFAVLTIRHTFAQIHQQVCKVLVAKEFFKLLMN